MDGNSGRAEGSQNCRCPHGSPATMPATLPVTNNPAGTSAGHQQSCRPTRQSSVIARSAGFTMGACHRFRQLPLPAWSRQYSITSNRLPPLTSIPFTLISGRNPQSLILAAALPVPSTVHLVSNATVTSPLSDPETIDLSSPQFFPTLEPFLRGKVRDLEMIPREVQANRCKVRKRFDALAIRIAANALFVF